MILRWVKSPQHDYVSSLSRYHKVEPPSQKNLKKRCVRWIYSPDSIDELIRIENFLELLFTGILFFHNRKPSVNELIFNKLSVALDFCEFLRFESRKLTYSDYKNGNWISLRKTTKWPILIIDNSDRGNIKEFIQQMNNESNVRECGIWICGYINELHTLIPAFFNALFLFDTSINEFNILRSRIALTESMIKSVGRHRKNYPYGEKVIFFWNYEKIADAPLLDANPKVISVSGIVGTSRYSREKDLLGKAGLLIKPGELKMDIYNISGQAGAVGPNSSVSNVTFNQVVNHIEKTMKISQLGDELNQLRNAMKKEAIETEHDIAISDIAKAEQAAKNKDIYKITEHLKSAGKWALEIATKIGVPVATEALKKAIEIE